MKFTEPSGCKGAADREHANQVRLANVVAVAPAQALTSSSGQKPALKQNWRVRPGELQLGGSPPILNAMRNREYYQWFDPQRREWVGIDENDLPGINHRQMRVLNRWVGVIGVVMLLWTFIGLFAILGQLENHAHKESNQPTYCISGSTC